MFVLIFSLNSLSALVRPYFVLFTPYSVSLFSTLARLNSVSFSYALVWLLSVVFVHLMVISIHLVVLELNVHNIGKSNSKPVLIILTQRSHILHWVVFFAT